MGFENIQFNKELENSNNELKFFREQIRLPREQWDKDFKKLVERKLKQNQEAIKELEAKGFCEISRKETPEETFTRYLEGLKLNEKDLRGKKVLDLGCGKEANFVKLLIKKNITPEAYGIDLQVEESILEEGFKNHIIKANFEEDFPIKNVDYIISVGAVSNGIWAGEEIMNVKQIIKNSLASLKPEGEIRIYPYQEVPTDTPLKGFLASQKKWEKLLAEITKTQKVEYKIEPVEIKILGGDVVINSVLIIRKR